MKPLILAIAVALPNYYCNQSQLAKKFTELIQLDSKTSDFVKKMCIKSQIKGRYCVTDDFNEDIQDGQLFNKKSLNEPPGTNLRNNLYIQEAPKLAKKAAQKALNHWNQDPKNITHIISVSCTGVMAPGIEFILQNDLGLSNNVQRIGINFMGCFGAFRGLAVAASIAKENANNRVLLVCTELCSLHFQISKDYDVLVSNSIFNDGAAAVIVGSQKTDSEKPLWCIEKSGSFALPKTQDKMTWRITDHGCIMTLSKDIPLIIKQNSLDIIKSFICNDGFNNYSWAIHPGGKAIIEAIEHSCCLTKQQTQASWDVLSNYGNMSSASFLFVLNELSKNINNHSKIIGLGFGPGLSFETILLKSENS